MITEDDLCSIMPLLKRDRAESYIGLLNAAMDEFDINTPERIAAFLAQLAHESAQLRYWEEIASGADYEGRADLGNTEPGDGVRYKGRGPIEITGRANYRAAGDALGVDFENLPNLAALPEYGFRIAAWFWDTHGLNSLADVDDFKLITKRINGGYNGMTDRLGYWQRAKNVLDVA
jgi:predicted chitinase